MAYNLDVFQRQLADLQSQLQSFQTQQPQPQSSVYQPSYISPQQVQVPIPARQVQYVEGIAGARKYQLEKLQPNSSEVIMDKNDNIFYHVSKDANGTPASRIPIGRFSIEEEPEQESTSLTRKDFDEFKEEIRQMFNSNHTPAPASAKATPKKEVVV